MVPAPGQGAIAIQARTEEKPFFIPLNDSDTEQAVLMERSVLNAFGGGCQVALGAHFSKDQGIFHFFHEACGIKCLKIDNREQEAWLSELIEWTKKK
jgi:porphobilinogen deaminase